jgi:hypothetical protein
MANLVAKDLRSPKYRLRVIKARKGKGSYNRKYRMENDDA